MKEIVKHILLVDDHPLLLKALKMILAAEFPSASFYEANTGNAALELIATKPVDAVILDISLPDISGLDIISRIKRTCPRIHIIVNTMHEEIWYVRQLLNSDVDGILFKSLDSSVIADAVRKVLSGEKFYCDEAARLCGSPEPADDNVTPRELDVLKLISEGMSNVEISRELSISVNTVDTHRRHLMEKLNAKNAADLVMTGISRGLIPINR